MNIPPDTRKGGCDCLPRPPQTMPIEAPPTTIFVLRYQDRWFGVEKRVTFAAADVAEALEMMEREPIGGWAELSTGGEIICRRGGEPDGAHDYWVVD